MPAERATKTVLAFVIAPLIVPFVFLLPLPGRGHDTVVNPAGWPLVLLVYAAYALPLAYIGEVLLGVPAWMVFRRYGIRSVLAFAGGGALIGLAFYSVFETVTYVFFPYGRQLRREYNISSNPFSGPMLYIDVIAATASAVVFRIIVFWGRRGETSD